MRWGANGLERLPTCTSQVDDQKELAQRKRVIRWAPGALPGSARGRGAAV